LKVRWTFKLTLLILAFLFLFGVSIAQEKPKAKDASVNPIALLTKAMTARLSNNLHVKNVVGIRSRLGTSPSFPSSWSMLALVVAGEVLVLEHKWEPMDST